MLKITCAIISLPHQSHNQVKFGYAAQQAELFHPCAEHV